MKKNKPLPPVKAPIITLGIMICTLQIGIYTTKGYFHTTLIYCLDKDDS